MVRKKITNYYIQQPPPRFPTFIFLESLLLLKETPLEQSITLTGLWGVGEAAGSWALPVIMQQVLLALPTPFKGLGLLLTLAINSV
jgi:hypothetical protein